MFEQPTTTHDWYNDAAMEAASPGSPRHPLPRNPDVLDLAWDPAPIDQLSSRDLKSHHTSGVQLRRRLVTAQSIADLAQCGKPSLVKRLLRRKQTAAKG